MADTKKEATGQDISAPASQDPDTKPVVDLLTSILNEVQTRVQLQTPIPPLDGKALEAANLFKKIVAALAVQPTITLDAVPDGFSNNQGVTTLTWSSTGAQTVSIAQKVFSTGAETVLIDSGAAVGSLKVPVPETTEFTATAVGPCGSPQKKKQVSVGAPV